MNDEYKMSEPLTDHNTIFGKYPKSQLRGYPTAKEWITLVNHTTLVIKEING